MDKKILVLENDEDTAFVISIILKSDGFIVIPTTVSDFDSDIKATQPNLILLDYRLDDSTTGGQLCKKLKTVVPTLNIPIILVSASVNLPDIAKDCLADAYIEKPFDLNYFLSVVNKLMT
jgi:CheY-like chemotaxis protein